MIEKHVTWRWVFVFAGAGILFGLVLGLVVGWAFPVSGARADPSALNLSDQNDYIVLVANSFAFDNDLTLARQRLAFLKDANIKSRVERLARTLSGQQDPEAPQVADLAVALGSNDSAIKVLAAAVTASAAGGPPTKVAKAAPTDTLEPSPTATNTVAPTETLQPTATLAKATVKPAAVVQNTPKPTLPPPTAVPPTAVPPPPPNIIPSLNLWYNSQYIPASVAPGQQYWRLAYARYCDWVPNGYPDPCAGMPGGASGTMIYVMALNPGGDCALDAKVHDLMNNGSVQPPQEWKDILYPWYNSPCKKDWEKGMYGEGNTISIEGLPSDTLTNLVMCSGNPPPGQNPPPCGHTHVRYFLVFQQATR